MTTPVLSLQDAALSLNGNAGRVEILHGITLSVQKGETLGLVGPSGSGKSSLLMLMGGLERATGGKIEALGRELPGDFQLPIGPIEVPELLPESMFEPPKPKQNKRVIVDTPYTAPEPVTPAAVQGNPYAQ